ncbi:syntaxin 7 [Trypanosoma grayi]|uniref:syntaxin 7 n=1 Tax=Trypanosoma grayi TaxID=71804 RepID=UPI0004F43097|nr:syntaxin 7 [Trypanosoma grayi]KEG10480.1 syntaxin 7 [Trypanosoma grayi]
MPLDEGETLARAVQQLRRACEAVSTATAELGTTRDAMAREKLRKARLLATQCEEKTRDILSLDMGAELMVLRGQYHAVKADFDAANKEAVRKEKQTWRSSTHADAMGSNGAVVVGEPLAGYDEVRLHEIKKIDMSEFHTEEALQREKLLGVREIESNMMDLKTSYQEFHDLVHHQQAGLDQITGNVSESKVHVENGTTELQQASRRQRCGRKMLCAIAIILLVIIIIVVVVVVVLKR